MARHIVKKSANHTLDHIITKTTTSDGPGLWGGKKVRFGKCVQRGGKVQDAMSSTGKSMQINSAVASVQRNDETTSVPNANGTPKKVA
jgi:hypothetical protein